MMGGGTPLCRARGFVSSCDRYHGPSWGCAGPEAGSSPT